MNGYDSVYILKNFSASEFESVLIRSPRSVFNESGLILKVFVWGVKE